MHQLKFRPEARRDLEDIEFDGASTFGHFQAMKYRDGLKRLFENLTYFPFIGTDLDSPALPGWRKFPYGAHIVVYSVTESEVVIRRVLSARMNWIDHLS